MPRLFAAHILRQTKNEDRIDNDHDDIDGSQVGGVYWLENDLERIKTYCQKDVITTARLLQKFKALNPLDDDQITFVD